MSQKIASMSMEEYNIFLRWKGIGRLTKTVIWKDWTTTGGGDMGQSTIIAKVCDVYHASVYQIQWKQWAIVIRLSIYK